MNSIRAAFYARVSSEQQAITHTIDSQLAALSERAQADGSPVPAQRQFVDNGYSGATLCAQHWTTSVTWSLSVASIAFMFTHPIDWPGITLTRCYLSMSGTAPVST
jgi:hypothetical protein